MATTKTASTALARQCQTAMNRRKPTAASRLNDLEPRVDTLVAGQAHLSTSVRQLDAEIQLLMQDVGVLVEQQQLAAALARVDALEARPVVQPSLLHNIQSQIVGFWIAIGAVAIAIGLCLSRAPSPASSMPEYRQQMPTPTASPTLKPHAKASKSKL